MDHHDQPSFPHVVDRWYNQSYTLFMKTAISIPDPIFEDAEELARRLGMSRSQLYATAVARFIDSYQEQAVTEKLNEIYAAATATVDPLLQNMQAQTLSDDDWS